jgi:hypothetical protein
VGCPDNQSKTVVKGTNKTDTPAATESTKKRKTEAREDVQAGWQVRVNI